MDVEAASPRQGGAPDADEHDADERLCPDARDLDADRGGQRPASEAGTSGAQAVSEAPGEPDPADLDTAGRSIHGDGCDADEVVRASGGVGDSSEGSWERDLVKSAA